MKQGFVTLKNNTRWYWSAARAACQIATGAERTGLTQTLFIPGTAGSQNNS